MVEPTTADYIKRNEDYLRQLRALLTDLVPGVDLGYVRREIARTNALLTALRAL